jgi:putative aldouronate transport system substrate-binding protein
MKKALAILLSLALLLGLAGSAFAEEDWITLRVETYDREITGLDVTNCWQLKYAQEHFGDPNHIKLEFVSFARWTEGELLTNALAGGTAPDICLTYNGSLVQQCIDDEGIWQLDDLLNEYGPNLKAFLGEELLTYGQSDHDGDGVKEQWYIPARRISRANVGNFIREDWLKALNMEKPTNIEEFTAYLEAAQEAKLGGDNTHAFAFGIYAPDPMYNVRRFTDAWVDFSKVSEEDWFAYARNPEMLEGAREGFRWLNTLYHKGIIPETFALTDNDQANDTALIMGYNGFFSQQPDQPWRTDKNYEIEMEKNVEGAHWITVNPFQNDSLGGKTLHDMYAPAGLSVIIPLTTDEKTAIAAIKYMDWMAEPDNMFAMQNGIEGINYEGLTEDGVPFGVKSADEVPDDHKMHAGDIVFISNGLCYGDDAKNAAALALPFKGYEDDVVASYADSLTDAWTQISFTVSIQAETDFGASVKSAQGKFLADVVSADPEKFDEVYDAGLQDILNSGAKQMIDEFRQAYADGNYRGVYPGNL